jgi:hypothetical protein
MTWDEINNLPRTTYGSETIEQGSIRATLPDSVTPDVKIRSFRSHQKTVERFLGYRAEQIFNVLFVDPKGALYDHT